MAANNFHVGLASGFITGTNRPPLRIISRPPVDIHFDPGRIRLPPPPNPPAAIVLTVKGIVVQPDGKPQTNRLVRAFDVGIRADKPLGEARTGATDGRYSITYKSTDLKFADRTSADLKITVYQEPDETKVASSSPIVWDADKDETVDVLLGDSFDNPSEYDQVGAIILPMLAKVNMKPADLVEDDNHKDISFLVGQSGLDRGRIEHFVTAHKLQASTNLDPEVLYGMYRQGVSTNPNFLLSRNPTVLQASIGRAMSFNIIRPKTTDQISAALKNASQAGIVQAIQPVGSMAKAPLGQLLETSTHNSQLFLSELNNFRGVSTDSFWKGLGEKLEFAGKVDDLQQTIKLGVVTLNHMPLVTELQRRLTDGGATGLKDFSDLSKYSHNDWVNILQTPAIGVPAEIPGDTPAEKTHAYAKSMSRIVEDAFPAKFVASRMADPDAENVLPAKPQVLSFLQKNPDFDFTNIRLPQYLKKKPDAFNGIANPEEAKKTVGALQRLYSIAPQYSQTRSLVANGVQSAMQISKMGQSSFVTKFSASLGGRGEALKVFDRAEQAHAMAFNLLARFGWANGLTAMPILKDVKIPFSDTEGAIPDLKTLFGSMDMCACDECRSVDGPAAYLVDILHFLSARELIDNDKTERDDRGNISKVVIKTRVDPASNQTVLMNVKDVLFARRPDIGEVELSCPNTTTPVPYIDLAIEVLEDAISPLPPFKPIASPPTAASDLNKKITTSIKSLFTPPLSDFAAVTVIDENRLWTIDEPAYTYTVRVDNGTLQVEKRSRQTKGSPSERAAAPQYMNPGVYDILKKQVYPWNLPFDLWTETVRTYLASIDVKRYEVMEAFSAAPEVAMLARKDVAFERLNLTTFEVGILTGMTTGLTAGPTTGATPGPVLGPTPRTTTGLAGSGSSGIWSLWGFGAETLSPQTAIPDPADKFKMITGGLWSSVLTGRCDIFLHQSGMKYAELLNAIQFFDIFGATDPLVIQSTQPADQDTCDLTKLQLVGAGAQVLHQISRFMRLKRKLVDWTIPELCLSYRAFGLASDQSGTEALLLNISYIQRLREVLSLPIEAILAFWSPISTVAYVDHEIDDEGLETASLFARTFRNKTISSQQDKIFTGDAATLNGAMSANTSALTGALSIGANDLAALLADRNIVADDVLSLANLSKLYRHSTLATVLQISIRDYLTLLKLHVSDVFASPLETVRFVRRVNNFLASSFSLAELNYFLRHEFTDDSGVSPPDDATAQFLDEIRTGLQRLSRENTYYDDTVDENGETTKTKLALLKWEPAVISQGVAILNNTVSFTVPIAAALPDSYQFPNEVNDKITYDGGSLRLSYTRVMTTSERDLLANSNGATSELKSAVAALFAAPRTFFARNFRTYSIQTFRTRLAALPAAVKIPSTLKDKVFFDVSTSTMAVTGALTELEQQSLLVNTDPVADVNYIAAVKKLMASPDTVNPAPGDSFVDPAQVSALFDSATNANGPIFPRTRFQSILQRLLPKLNLSLSSQYVIQKISQTLGIENQVAEPLLNRWVQQGGQPVGSILRADAFFNSNLSVPITKTTFNAQFKATALLQKVALLVQKWSVTKKQAQWLFEFRTRQGDPASAWLDLNSLPVQPVTTQKVDFAGWERLMALFRLRDALPVGEVTLDAVFTKARTAGVTVDGLLTELSAKTAWPLADLKYLAGPQGFNLPFPAAFQDEAALISLMRCLDLLKKIGCSAADGSLYAKPDQGQDQALAIVQTIKAKYDQALWTTVARPIRDVLRARQRTSLVSYLLAHPDPSTLPIWRNSNDLYAYYLMDVEMGPAQLTSRVKQAISVTQLFVQRSLMNLEREVVADAEYDRRWLEWKTLKSFRVTSAARQVFARPENFLDPSLRDDKTPFFKDLEAELQQNDLTIDVAENSLFNYLEKLDAVSHLQVVSFYHQQGTLQDGPKSVDILHVFAKNSSQPPTYYYRRRVDAAEWTAWERVDADVSGDHLIPIIWRQRLILFWALFTEKQASTEVRMPSGSNPISPGETFWEMRLAWSELKNGKWLAKTISDDVLLCPKSGRGGVLDTPPTSREVSDGVSLITFRTAGGGDIDYVSIQAQCNNVEPGSLGSWWFEDMKTSPSVTEDWRDLENRPEFWYSLAFEFPSYKLVPMGTRIRGMTFAEDSTGTNRNQLILNTNDFKPGGADSETLEKLAQMSKNVTILGATPGKFNVVFAHQDQQFSSQRPFFFQHAQKSFFVEPSNAYLFLPGKRIFDNINPTHLDGSIFSRHIDKSQIALPKIRGPAPKFSGPNRFLSSFEISDSENLLSRTRPRTPAMNDTRTFSFQPAANKLSLLKPIMDLDIVRKAVQIDTSRIQLPVFVGMKQRKKYKFSVFYHPYVNDFVQELNRNGIDGLLDRSLQLKSRDFFDKDYEPDHSMVSQSEFPKEEVEMDNGSMSQYNWELFYHIPITIADKLSRNQRFEEAQAFYHYIFDPTDASSFPSPQRFWRTKKFFDTTDAEYSDEATQNLFKFLAARGDPNEKAKLSTPELKHLDNLEAGVRRWRKDPFNPFLVARTRSTAFQKSVVMKYLDNLIAWGDQLFRADTLESINEATQLFILAADILGERPVEIPRRAGSRIHTYNSLEPKLDEFSNALVQIEELVPPASDFPSGGTISSRHQMQVATSTMLYFCVPKNDKLLTYWDTISDRLFKIRNSMNLQGITRNLALFEPPIDPALLIKASASGVDLGSILSDVSVPLPQYRYTYIAAKARELCAELIGLGSSFSAALEKRDAEGFALLRSSHEMSTLNAVRSIKVASIEESQESLTAVEKSKEVVKVRNDFYTTRDFMSPWEITSMGLEGVALVMQIIDAATQPVAAATSMIPQIKVGAPTTMGAEFGGENISKAAAYFGAFLNRGAGCLSKAAGLASTVAGYWRRKQEWDHNAALAQKEMEQIDFQIAAARIKIAIAEKELKSHDLLVRNAREIDDYTRSKFTNKELYDWTVGQLSTIYFQSYQMAFDTAKRAERAYAYELGLPKADFIQFGYWDSLKNGLLAGEKLAHDLKGMGLSYMELDRREYEITRTISVAHLDPVALIQLKETGECFFNIPEALYDLDFPGHYFRRIKTVSISIPAVVGPYTSVSSTLTLFYSAVRTVSTPLSGNYARRDNDPRFSDSYAQAQSIVTSSAQNDSGLFQLNFQDDRYLPFERCGAVSSWRLQLSPPGMSAFDVHTIQDVLLHVKYTAREAGEPLRSLAVSELRSKTLAAIARAEGASGLARMFSLRHEFSNAWSRMLRPAGDAISSQEMNLSLDNDRFPFIFRGAKSLQFKRVEVFIRVKPELATTTHSPDKLRVSFFAQGAAAATAGPPSMALVGWNGTARGAMASGNPAGNYTLRVGLQDGSRLLASAVDEILLVVSYEVKWA